MLHCSIDPLDTEIPPTQSFPAHTHPTHTTITTVTLLKPLLKPETRNTLELATQALIIAFAA